MIYKKYFNGIKNEIENRISYLVEKQKSGGPLEIREHLEIGKEILVLNSIRKMMDDFMIYGKLNPKTKYFED